MTDRNDSQPRPGGPAGRPQPPAGRRATLEIALCLLGCGICTAGRGPEPQSTAPPEPQRIEASRRFAQAARQRLTQKVTEFDDPRETAALYAAEAVRLAQNDDQHDNQDDSQRDRQGDGLPLSAALALLRSALARVSGTALRIHPRVETPFPPAVGALDVLQQQALADATISALTLNPGGSLVACGTHSGLIYVWHIDTGGGARLAGLLTTTPLYSTRLAFAAVTQLQLLFRGRWLVVVSADESGQTIDVRDVATGFSAIEAPSGWRHARALAANTAALLRADGSAVDLWQAGEGGPRLVGSYTAPAHPIRAMFFSADGRRLLAIHDARAVAVLEGATGHLIRKLALPPAPRAPGLRPRVRHRSEPEFHADLSPDGRVLILQEATTIDVALDGPLPTFEQPQTVGLDTVTAAWDLSRDPPVSLPELIPDPEDQATEFHLSRSNWLGVAGGLKLTLRNLAGPSLGHAGRYTFQHPDKVEDYHRFTGLAFDRGARAPVGTRDGSIELRLLGNSASMAHPVLVPGLPNAVPLIAPDGQRMLVWSRVLFADETGLARPTLGSLIRVCDLDRDCRGLPPASGGRAGARGLLAEARRVIGRNLTLQEWTAVLPDAPYEKTFDDLPPDFSAVQRLIRQADTDVQAGQPDMGGRAAQQALEDAIVAGNPFLLEDVIRMALRRARPELAERAADALLALLPQDPRVLRYRGWARALQAQHTAIPDLDRYVRWARTGGEDVRSDQEAMTLLRQGGRPDLPPDLD